MRLLRRIVLNMATPLNRFFCFASKAPLLLYLTWYSVVAMAQPATTPDPTATTPDPTAPAEQPTPTPIPSERPVPDLEARTQQLIAEELSKEEVVWLEAGADKFPAVWKADTSGDPFGAILLIHGAGQTLDWPSSLHELRNSLTDFGWSTLSISLPQPVLPPPPPRPSAPPAENPAPTDSIATNDDDATTPELSPEISARLQAAVAYLNSRGQYNLAIAGEDVGALWATQYVARLARDFAGSKKNRPRGKVNAKMSRPVRALVLINARNSVPYQTGVPGKHLSDWFNDPGLPVLDVYFGSHFLDEKEPAMRAKNARRKRLTDYVQLQLVDSPIHSSGGETQLSRRVRGFLNKHAKGVELEASR